MTQLNNIAFRVFPSPDTNDHEVRIFVDGKPFIAEHWSDMMGLDPDDILANGELSLHEEPHRTMVVRLRGIHPGIRVFGLPGDRVVEILRKYNRMK